MRILSSLMLATTLLSAVPAMAAQPTAEARLAKTLDGRVAGKPVNCINLGRIDSSQIFDRTAIVYRDGATLYVNRPDFGAQSLDSSDILVTDTWTQDLCSVDTVKLYQSGSRMMSGVVGLGAFVPYTKAARD